MRFLYEALDLRFVKPLQVGDEVFTPTISYPELPGKVLSINTYNLSNISNDRVHLKSGDIQFVLNNFAYADSSGFNSSDTDLNKSLQFDGIDDFALCQNMVQSLTDFTIFFIRNVDSNGYTLKWGDFFSEQVQDDTISYTSRGSAATSVSKSTSKILVADRYNVSFGPTISNFAISAGSSMSSSECRLGNSESSYCKFDFWLLEVYDRILSTAEKTSVLGRIVSEHKLYTGYDLT